MGRASLSLMALLLVGQAVRPADKPTRRTGREALQAFNHLIGDWKGTGNPEGTREEKNRGLWTESQSWVWQFKGDKVWLKVTFAKSKNFSGGELRYLPDKNQYQLTLRTPAKETLTFTGKLAKRRLILERTDPKTHEGQRLAFTFLHPNRFLYAYETKPKGGALFTRLYRVGATKKGVKFAEADNQPECVVSGGLGRYKVTYQGKTYYVCCSGCREEFNDNPAKYVKAYEEKKAKEKKK
jgi:YHS domain-containing protein